MAATAAAAGNGPLAPHHDQIRYPGQANMGFTSDEPVTIPQTLRWCGDVDMNLASSPSECLGDLYRLIPGESHIRLTGASYTINPTHCHGISDCIFGAREPFLAAAAMVMLCCWWLLAVLVEVPQPYNPTYD